MSKARAKKFIALAVLAGTETAREPVCLLLTTACIGLIGLLPLLITHTFGDAGELVRDSAFSFHFLAGLLLGGYAASSALAGEMRRGTASLVLTKPVSRDAFFLAKFAGIGGFLVLFSLGAALATLISQRMAALPYEVDWWAGIPLLAAIPAAYLAAAVVNFATSRPFVSNCFVLLLLTVAAAFVFAGVFGVHGQHVPFGARYAWRLLPASALITLGVLVLAGIAASLATRLPAVPTLSICGLLFLLGLVSHYFFGDPASGHAATATLYAVIPNWQHFWGAGALQNHGVLPWSYVGLAAVYACLYLTGVLAIGLLAFRGREVRE